jgi:hypothetical protein
MVGGVSERQRQSPRARPVADDNIPTHKKADWAYEALSTDQRIFLRHFCFWRVEGRSGTGIFFLALHPIDF